MLGIVVSDADSASVAIGERLLDSADWETRNDDSRPSEVGGGAYRRLDGDDPSSPVELRRFEDLHLDLVDAAAAFDDPDLLVFASRHAGDTGPLLTAHVTGNFGPADHGGEDRAFARAAPNAQVAVLAALDEHAPEGYEVGIECTHHGPTRVGVPSMFVELGSGPEQWEDPAGAAAVAHAILSLRGVDPDRVDYGARSTGESGETDGTGTSPASTRHVVGFGGGHYAPRFERVLRETDWAVGHLGSDWQLDAMGHPREHRAVLRRAFEASAADLALVEGERAALRETIDDLGYRAVSESFLRATAGVPRDVVAALETRLCSVEAGLRFGDPAVVAGASDVEADGTWDHPVEGPPDGGAEEVPAPDALDVVDLPDELLAEAQGIDAGAAREAVASTAVAFETVENGTRARGRAAVRPGDRPVIVDALAAVLETGYEHVAVEDDAVVARTEAFDPDLARTLGISEGPAFGKLADGETVEVDGERIDPEVVHRERVERFPR